MTTNITGAGVKQWMDTVIKALDRNIGLELSYLGTEAVNRTRDRGAAESWIDRTGNLRSSIGMAVYQGHQLRQKSGFQATPGPDGTGATGSTTGTSLVEQLAEQMGGTQSLAVVAGMEYASYVEARDNKDVLASTEGWMRTEIAGRMRDAVEDTMALANRIKIGR